MLWLKAFHLIAMTAWFSGLFYLPRLFVYHSLATDQISLDRFKIMEKKLYYIITTPAMILTIFLGGWLLVEEPFYLYSGWLKLKLVLVSGLVFYHVYCGYLIHLFKQNRHTHTHTYYRILNEIPVLFLMAIIILAVVKP